MSETYYEPKDLEDFANIGEYATETGAKFFDYYATGNWPPHRESGGRKRL